MKQPFLFASREASCILSPCERYRYSLRIPLGHDKRTCVFIMANPSTALVVDGVFNSDPTVTRCMNYARSWGYGTLIVENVRSWRETDPKKVPPDPLAIGPDNDAAIMRSAQKGLVVCAWGTLGGWRGLEVSEMLRAAGVKLHALRLNADRSPAHPLYLPAGLLPVRVG